LKILIVEDDRDTAGSLATLLQFWGHAPCPAYDGPAALAMAHAFRPDVALLDLALPSLDGYAVAEFLRQLPGLGRVALVALTGYGDAAYCKRSADAGFLAHLVKPIDPLELQALLVRLAWEKSKFSASWPAAHCLRGPHDSSGTHSTAPAGAKAVEFADSPRDLRATV
jgi:CheY-like chemotaxis protein